MKIFLQKIFIFLNCIFAIMVVLFFLDGLSILEIKGQKLKDFIYWGFMLGAVLMLILNVFFLNKSPISFALPIVAIASVIHFTPMLILFSMGSWHTQSIIYENAADSSLKVESQMRSTLRYQVRTVEVKYFTPFFMISKPVDWNKLAPPEWKLVDKEINEFGLKGG